MKFYMTTALLTATLSTVAWTYRFVDEYSPYQHVAFYILVPIICWGLFIGTASLLRYKQLWVRIVAGVLLIPCSLLWALSVWIGFYGLKIH